MLSMQRVVSTALGYCQAPTTTVLPSMATDQPNSLPDVVLVAVSLATWPYVALLSVARET